MKISWSSLQRLCPALCAVLIAGSNVTASAAYRTRVLIANKPEYQPNLVDPLLINAWGLANRPAGLGGHFWIANHGRGSSDEYVGDVSGVPLYQDNLTIVSVSGSVPGLVGPTGVVFNQSAGFVISQAHPNGLITAPAKFLFATDSGIVSGWTERQMPDGSKDFPSETVTVIDRSNRGSAFFGIAVDDVGTRIFVADFGVPAGIRIYDHEFREISEDDRFLNPWATPKDRRRLISRPGLFTPFNVQAATLNGRSSLFVPYCKTKAGEERHWVHEPAEEDGGPGQGRLAEFDFEGKLVARWRDRGALNAPWGVAVAPPGFGPYTGYLLVGNFGDGTITVFDPATRTAVDWLRDDTGEPIHIDGLWGLLPGNGGSLGESFRVYFAAGPRGEQDGIFGYLEWDRSNSTRRLRFRP